MNEFFGVASLVVALIQYLPYCWRTWTGALRPHAFAYVIWGVGAAIVAGAQWVAGAGPGAWAMALIAGLCFIVVALSLRQGAGYVTRKDVWTLVLALAALPLWLVLRDPLVAVMLITGIDIAAYAMIYRKLLRYPAEDSILFYAIAVSQYVLTVLATTSWNLTTLLNPVALILCGIGVIVLMAAGRMSRRRRARASRSSS